VPRGAAVAVRAVKAAPPGARPQVRLTRAPATVVATGEPTRQGGARGQGGGPGRQVRPDRGRGTAAAARAVPARVPPAGARAATALVAGPAMVPVTAVLVVARPVVTAPAAVVHAAASGVLVR
jgi:hypothetical protein